MVIELQHGRRARRTRRTRGTTTGTRAAGDCRVMFRPADPAPAAAPHDAARHRAEARHAQRKARKRARAVTGKGPSARALSETGAAVARELHDDLGQLIALAQLRLSELALTRLSPQASRLAAQLQTLMAQCSTSLRRSCFALARPDLGAPEPQSDMAAGIERHCRELAASFEQRIEFHCEGQHPSLPAATTAIVLRAARELIVNACKHAQAHRIDACMRCSAAELRLEVSDDGLGIGAQPPRGDGFGFGLASLRHQLAALGAQLSIASQPGGGTLCRLQLPLQFPSTRHL